MPTVAPIVIVLPFAGAGASVFRDWADHARGRYDVLPIQLPGREERLDEEPLIDMTAAAADAHDQVARQVTPDRKVALFGHSMGAVLAFETAKRLEGNGHDVIRLFVSGSPSPWNGRQLHATGLNDEDFLAEVRHFAGYGHPALAIPEMRELLLPMMRADVCMHESYYPVDATLLRTNVVAMRGVEDDLVSATQTRHWADTTTGSFTSVEVMGSHMYLVRSAGAVADLIAAELEQAVKR